MKKRIVIFAVFFSLFSMGVISSVYAATEDVPVVDLSQNAPASQQDDATTAQPQQEQTQVALSKSAQAHVNQSLAGPVQTSLSLNQRVSRLEVQMNNLTQMNLPAKIDELQLELQQLRGELEVQSHELKTLNEQQRNFYQDLDQRLNRLQVLVTGGTIGTSMANAAAPSDNATKTVTKAKQKTAKANSLLGNERKAYLDAFNLLKNKQYDQATTAFQSYLTNYPNGKYAVNSHFWLGEIYYLQRKTAQAGGEFTTVVSKYPKSQKVPDAMLKLAAINNAAGNQAKAKQILITIKKRFPKSTAAQLATTKLRKMAKQSSTTEASS